MGTRKCITCGKVKDESGFSLRGGRNQRSCYYKSECRTCATARATAWRISNRERYNEYHNEHQKETRRKASKMVQVESNNGGLDLPTHEQGEGK